MDQSIGVLQIVDRMDRGGIKNFVMNVILDVLKEALKIESNTVHLFSGDGPLEDDAKQKAAEMGLIDKCVLLGMRSNIPDVMQAMDVLAMPSLFENFQLQELERGLGDYL